MSAQEQINLQTTQDEENFSLNAAQMVFMMNSENAMRRAESEDDIQFFRDLAASNDFKALFGDMSIDQAIDRYEVMTGTEI